MVVCLIVALGTGIVLARSDSHAIPWDTIAGGGSEMSSASYAINGTIGLPVIGPGSSSNYSIGAGYWYGVGDGSSQLFLPVVIR